MKTKHKLVTLQRKAYWKKVKEITKGITIQHIRFNEPSGTSAVDWSGNGLNGAYSNVTLGQTGPREDKCASFNGTNSFCNLHSAGLASAFSAAAGFVMIVAKVSGAGVLTDGTLRVLTQLRADTSNRIRLFRNTGNNAFVLDYTAGGTASQVPVTITTSDWFQLILTWDTTADEVKGYLNETQQGSTLSSLGTWSGAINAAYCTHGANDIAGNNSWDGYLAVGIIGNAALTQAQVTALARAGNF